MSTTSRIPAATDALVAALTASIGTTVSVIDGPPLNWDNITAATNAVSQDQWLFVGATPDSDVSMDGTQDFNAAGAVSRDEHLTIYCTAYVWGGDEVAKTNRDNAFAVVAAAEQVIRADPSLSAAVLYARLAEVTAVAQRQTEAGSDCTVIFTVEARAYLD